MEDAAIRDAILTLAHQRGTAASFCPSDVARRLAGDWRPLMPRVRQVAGALQAEGWVQATQKGAPVDPVTARGPIRLRLAPTVPRG
jgi:hypothetical protein